MVEDAGDRGVELLVLPELWPCGYDPVTLADDARQAAEPRPGPAPAAGSRAAGTRTCGWPPGSVPELGRQRCLYNTALVFNPARRTRRLAPQGPPLPTHRRGTGLQRRGPPDHLRGPDARAWSALSSASTGTSPRWPARLRWRAPAWSSPPRPTRSRAAIAWDLLYPAWRWPTASGGSRPTSAAATRLDVARGEPDPRAHRNLDRRGGRALPGGEPAPELLVNGIDLSLKGEEELAAPPRQGRLRAL